MHALARRDRRDRLRERRPPGRADAADQPGMRMRLPIAARRLDRAALAERVRVQTGG
ncbi:MAG: hypothetical protein IPL61_26430 [Myxococcales bacterium]|nr:hypothetical protein [Myxococcales bacterium]